MKNISKLNIILCVFTSILLVTSCELDDRADDLTGGYRGAFIDKNTGDTICTEYYGATIKMLDIEYGTFAQPLSYKTLPDGTFQNTKIYPSKYKVWADGPFFSLDTIYGDVRTFKEMNLLGTPNITLKIKDIEIELGIIANVTFSYNVNDLGSQKQEIGIVYSPNRYPGQMNAMTEGNIGSTFKRIKTVTNLQGEFTESFSLGINETYFFRALGRTASAGDYWNYSKQEIIRTGSIDIAEIPINTTQGASSATSAILQWSLPNIVDKIKLSYIDKDGININDEFSLDSYIYAANLPHGQNSSVKVSLIGGGKEGPEKTIEVKTKALNEQYIPQKDKRPENISLFNDKNIKYSISRLHANIEGPKTDHMDWVDNSLNHEFIDWWDGWLNTPQYLPTCENMEGFTEIEISGGITNLVDLLPCVNLEKIIITEGTQFSAGETIDPNVDLRVLNKLKKLHTIVIGSNIPLSEEMFRKVGVEADIIIQ